MTKIAPDTLVEAFSAWMLDVPPIAHPCPDPLNMAAIRISKADSWPTALIDGTPHYLVGVTPSGWLSVAGVGWRRFRGAAAEFTRIAAVCNAAQIVAMADRSLFECALRFHAKRFEMARVGGLEWIETEDGQRWVRVDDIICPDVKAAFYRHLAADGGEGVLRIRYNLGSCKMDFTLVCTDAWWLFARQWTESSIAI